MALGSWRAPWILLALSLVLASCQGGEETQEAEIVLGVVVPLSGPDSLWGRDVLSGLTLAAQTNTTPRLALRIADGEGSPVPSARSFRELAANPSVHAIVGGVFASTARTLAALANVEEISFLALSPLAVPPGSLPAPGLFPLHRVDSLSRASARFAREDLASTRAGILTVSGSEVAAALAESFAQTFDAEGGELLWRVTPNERGELDPSLLPLRPIDVLFVAGPSEIALRFRELVKTSHEAPVILVEGWQHPELQGLLRLGSPAYLTTFFSVLDPSEATREFLGACAAGGVAPSESIAFGWDAASLIRRAAEEGGTSREGIRSYLRLGGTFEGASGELTRSPVDGVGETPAVCAVSAEGLVFVRRVATGRSAPGGEA
jgi:branched-chain amino acid transport system substrate-binding protein